MGSMAVGCECEMGVVGVLGGSVGGGGRGMECMGMVAGIGSSDAKSGMVGQ